MKQMFYQAIQIGIICFISVNVHGQQQTTKTSFDSLKIIGAKNYVLQYDELQSNQSAEKKGSESKKSSELTTGSMLKIGSISRTPRDQINLKKIDSLVTNNKVRYYQGKPAYDSLNINGKQVKNYLSR